ncbi:hypothetical protein CsSME_00035706 [Camellia sinensis var. sinensis]
MRFHQTMHQTRDKPKKAHDDFLHQISLISSSSSSFSSSSSSSANLPCPIFHHIFILSWSFLESLPSNPSHSKHFQFGKIFGTFSI